MEEKKTKDVYCEMCGATFFPELKSRQIGYAGEGEHDAIHETYFACPECGKHFTVLITDTELRGLIVRRSKLADEFAEAVKTAAVKLGRPLPKSKRNYYLKELKILKNRTEKKAKELVEKYAGKT